MGLIDGFIVGRLIAQNNGVQDEGEANRIGLVAGATGGGSQGLILAAVLAQQATPDSPPAPPGVSVPPLAQQDFDKEAAPALQKLGLKAVRQDSPSTSATIGTVISQSP